MNTYDPDTAPDSGAWLALDEGERLALVVNYHEQAGDEMPNVELHAAIHAIVENQLAEGYIPAIEALTRLMRDGLGRHDAIHAIGAVLSELIWNQGRDRVRPARITNRCCACSRRSTGANTTVSRSEALGVGSCFLARVGES